MSDFDPADYADLDPDPWELLQVEEALAESEAEEAAGLPYDADDDADGDPADPDDGPGGSWADQLEAAGAALDGMHALDSQRAVEDITDQLDRRTPTDEVRAARALRRIEAGTYLPPQQLRGDPAAAAAARDPSGRWASACGPLDPLGRCGARFHDQSCHTVTEGAAATGSYEEAEAWADTLQHRAPDPGALGFANESGAEPHDPLGVDFDDVLDDGSRLPYDRLRDQVMHRMGLSDRESPEPRGPRPDVSWAREAMGL